MLMTILKVSWTKKKFHLIVSIFFPGDDKDDASESGNGRGKNGGKHRGPCEPLPATGPMQMEVVKPPKNQNESFGHGMVLKITCETGYNSNIQTPNSTVRCNKGVWKPVKPTCSLSKKFYSVSHSSSHDFPPQNHVLSRQLNTENTTRCRRKTRKSNKSSQRRVLWRQWTKLTTVWPSLFSVTQATTFKAWTVWSALMEIGHRQICLSVCQHRAFFQKLCMLHIKEVTDRA